MRLMDSMESVVGSTSGALSRLWSSDTDKDKTCESWGLSKKERIIGFFTTLILGLLCFIMAIALSPMLVLRARKFAILFTLGSVCSLGSFSFLWGPWEHVKHLLSVSRLPFTISYLTTIALTLYCALGLHNTLFTLICAVAQLLALIWFLVSYLPGGVTGLSFMSKLFSRLCMSTVSNAMSV
ncbi:uncharacterized protein LOC135334849 [Halichondria panicea]|uniref:uncharacterized protein LOC135334849 n=1 Tax=Halichondria panicea TaxID=6063 RepID=UPI00312BC7E8